MEIGGEKERGKGEGREGGEEKGDQKLKMVG